MMLSNQNRIENSQAAISAMCVDGLPKDRSHSPRSNGPYCGDCQGAHRYLQVLDTFRRFQQVTWPPVVDEFLNALSYLNLDLAVLPLNCILGHPVDFYVRLVATLFVPLFGSACIFGLAALAALSRRKDRAEGLDDHALSAPRVWVLHQWLLLLLYPMLCHTIMSTFDCIDLRGEYLLRSDVTVVCYQGSWFAWATVAIFAGILYCIGVPLAAFAAARAYKDSRGRQRQRVLLLLNPYIASFWWFESVDLIRKCLLTSVVLITYAGTTLQLGFGWVIAAASCLIYTNLQPYRGRLCGHISTTAQLSILFTYITAILLASYEVTEFTISKDQFRSQAFVGPMLMLSNLACFILLAGFFLLRAAQASDRTDFTLLLNGAPIQLLDPNAAGGHHIFLSHCWAHAQDQCAEIKRAVNMLLPSVQIFLDVDDLQDIAELERHVQDSDLLLIFLTKEYFSSANCRRELKQGLTLGKEIVVITECDAMHGASTLDELQAEIEELPPEERAACEAILLAVENADAIEWHREIYLKRVALRHIVYKLCRAQNDDGVVEVTQQSSTPIRLAAPVYISPHYRRIRVPGPVRTQEARERAFQQVQASFAKSSINLSGDSMVSSKMASSKLATSSRLASLKSISGDEEAPRWLRKASSICSTLGDAAATVSNPDPEAATEASPSASQTMSQTESKRETTIYNELFRTFLNELQLECCLEPTASSPVALLLAPGIFANTELVEELKALLKEEPRRTLLPFYSTAVPFDFYINNCPAELKQLGLLKIMFTKWPAAPSLQVAAATHALAPLSIHGVGTARAVQQRARKVRRGALRWSPRPPRRGIVSRKAPEHGSRGAAAASSPRACGRVRCQQPS